MIEVGCSQPRPMVVEMVAVTVAADAAKVVVADADLKHIKPIWEIHSATYSL